MKFDFEKKYQIPKKLSEKKITEIYGENFNVLLAKLLFVRGIDTLKKTENFLTPKWEDNHNPFLFSQMEKSVNRILKAIKNNQKILIFSDYDTDGIPGGALLYRFFEKIKYKNFQNFIPNRNRDGYGLTEKLAKKIITGKIFDNSLFGESLKKNFLAKLVITIDCGITDVQSAKILKENKIDLIITDHHIVGEEIPEAFSILNHKMKNEKYPDKNLCGTGIIFKLVQAIMLDKKFCQEKEISDGWEKWLLDLVSISTVCDMVPLKGENRILVKYGKVVLEKTQNKGLKKIIEKSRIDKNNISTEDLGFMLGPRINAASRLEDPFFAFEALAKNSERAEKSAEYLETLNNKRKYLIAKIMKDVWNKLSQREDSKVIVIGDKDWPLGILGLVAGKIADKYKKPVFVWSKIETEKELKGSCRSGERYSVYSLMKNNNKEFVNFGGHSMSGGFVIKEEKIHFLEQKLSENLKTVELVEEKKIIIDAEICLDDINLENYYEMEKLEPCGMGNQKPHFLLKNIKIFSIKEFGKEKQHLELNFKNSKNFLIKSIFFFYKDIFNDRIFKIGEKINLTASFELNRWNGNKSLRLKIEDIF